MDIESIWLSFAFFLGLMARLVKLPPLIGYLLAGFMINLFSSNLAITDNGASILEHVSHLGVLLLLFSIGLKLSVKSLVRPEVMGPGLAHFVVITLSYVAVFHFIMDIAAYTALILGIALSFSSTVLSAKFLESKNELQAFHGRVAIGILILQDIFALITLGFTTGVTPSPYALLLLFIPLMRPLIFKLIDLSGKDDLFIILGLYFSLVLGGHGFEALGLSSEIGALLLGILIAPHPKSTELSDSLWSIKEFFLVGFFLKIGLQGLPSVDDWIFAIGVNLFLWVKGILFFFLLILFKLKARSAFLTSLSLTAFSEFGLILSSLVLKDWMIPLALTVSLSFLISAPLNALSHKIFDRFYKSLCRFERNIQHPDEQPIYLEGACTLILGLGRTGTAALRELQDNGINIIGIDSNNDKVQKYKEEGLSAHYGDAEDPQFWEKLKLGPVHTVLLCLSDFSAKIVSVRRLRKQGFTGQIVAHCMDNEEEKKLLEEGASYTYLTLIEAGKSLAQAVIKQETKY